MKQREDTIRKWFSLWLDSREAELSDLFTEDAAYIESWGPEYYGREMIARWFRDWHRSGQVLRWDIQEFLDSENTTDSSTLITSITMLIILASETV